MRSSARSSWLGSNSSTKMAVARAYGFGSAHRDEVSDQRPRGPCPTTSTPASTRRFLRLHLPQLAESNDEASWRDVLGGSELTMSNTVSETPLKVAPQVYDHIRALLRAGRNDEAIARSCAVIVMRPDDLVAKKLLFDVRSEIGCRRSRWQRNWCAVSPDIARLQKALIATLSNMKR